MPTFKFYKNEKAVSYGSVYWSYIQKLANNKYSLGAGTGTVVCLCLSMCVCVCKVLQLLNDK